MQNRLTRHRLRVPQGSHGVSWVLRIERGDLALEPDDRDRRKRGAALGQDSLGRKDVRSESTRSSQETGRITPTLGVSVAGSGSPRTTRVVLLRERPL